MITLRHIHTWNMLSITCWGLGGGGLLNLSLPTQIHPGVCGGQTNDLLLHHFLHNLKASISTLTCSTFDPTFHKIAQISRESGWEENPQSSMSHGFSVLDYISH